MLITVPSTSTKLKSKALLSAQELSVFNNSELFIVIPASGTTYIENGLTASASESVEIPSAGLTLASDGNWNVINNGSAATVKVLPI